jgi:putative (di)nucleoside polyphosphate hydrolase
MKKKRKTSMTERYRPNVAALIVRLNKHGKVQMLLGQRRDFPGCWQWPQGGIDHGETREEALFREIEEETGLTGLNILFTYSKPIRYVFDRQRREKFQNYIGQEQFYFVLNVHNDDPGLHILKKTHNSEFSKLRWKSPEHAVSTAPAFKKKAYEKAYEIYKKLPVNKALLAIKRTN